MRILVLLILLSTCSPASAIFGDFLESAADAVKAVAETAANAAKSVWETGSKIVTSGIKVLGEGANVIVDAAGNILSKGISILSGAANAVFDVAGNIIGTGFNLLGKGANEIINAAGKVISIIVDPFNIWKSDDDLDHGHSTGRVVPCPAVADIFFVLDASRSVGATNFAKQLEFAKRLTEHFRIGPSDVQFGAIVFSSQAQKRFELTTFKDHVSLGQAITSIPYSAGGTKTYLALDLISNEGLLSVAKGARTRSSKIVIVITDGISDNVLKTKTTSDKLSSSGIQVIAVGIGLANLVELHAIASGFLSNVFSAFGYNKLFHIEQKLARRTCDIPTQGGFVPVQTPPQPVTCISGFTNDPANPKKCVDIDECRQKPCEQNCYNTIGGYVCSCREGFTVSEYNPLRCQEVKPCTAVADIILVIDSSGSIGEVNYKLQLEFIANLARHFKISEQGVRFGAILFSNGVEKLFDLNTLSTSQQVQNALRTAPYLQGATYTNRALDYIIQYDLFSASLGGRKNAIKIAILLTDGESTEPELTQQAGTRLKANGITIVPLGIGQGVNGQEITDLASSPEDLFYVVSFNMLSSIEERLAERTCGKVNGKK